MSQQHNHRIAIVGGSVGGLFAGVLLHRAGFDVRIFERSGREIESRGAGLGAQADLLQLLHEVDREEVAENGVAVKERIFLDRDNVIADRQSVPQKAISWDRIFAVFRPLIPDLNYKRDATVIKVWQQSEECFIKFADGSVASADIVIGADGVGSVMREVVSPDDYPEYAGYVAWRGLVPESQFNAEDKDVLLDRFAFYNMPHSQMLVIPDCGC